MLFGQASYFQSFWKILKMIKKVDTKAPILSFLSLKDQH